ncbi:MAG TPA: EamA family transporter [Candidatus Eremiobacteraeota bacterium]|nr:MAG: EamA-like transporter family protein [bacterium ADurb.Bin363]HPZ08632.1 EamA family transporter [Candidatus Eremiobacteraeota bacterium]
MKPVVFAILTAICWSVGGFFEKKGLHMGNLSPVMGITIRTAVALIILGIASYPFWNSLTQAGTKPLLYLIIGGGIIAGSLGMLCFYAGIHTGELSRVIPVAFGLTPLLGFLLGVFILKEPLTPLSIPGVILVSLGVICICIK